MFVVKAQCKERSQPCNTGRFSEANQSSVQDCALSLTFIDICWFFTAVCSVGSVVWVPALLSIACSIHFCDLVLLMGHCHPSSGEDAKSTASSSVIPGLVLDWVCINSHMDRHGWKQWGCSFDHSKACYQAMAATHGHSCFLWFGKSERLFEPVDR